MTKPAQYLIQGGLLYNKAMAGKQFKPFEHDDLELKNQLIFYARSIANKKEAEAQLACAMIYASFAEYIGGHLLDNLRHLMYIATHRDFAAILFIDQRNSDKKYRTMNRITGLLSDFEFPDKKAILNLLDSISKSRNNLFHNLAKTDSKGLKLLDDDIDNIKEKSEQLFEKVNNVYAGLQKVLLQPQVATDITSGKKDE